jgi:triphosphatase
MSAPNMEMEFKFELAADFDRTALINWLTADEPGRFLGVKRYHDIYYDTPSGYLYQAGLACRRRIVDNEEKIEIKLQPKKDDALFRSRCEWSLDPLSPQRGFSEKYFRRFIENQLELPVPGKLEPIAIINSERRKWRIIFKQCSCELSDDAVIASVPSMTDKDLRFNELELELLNPGRDAEADFDILGKALQERFQLKASETSKLERTLTFFNCNPCRNAKPSYRPDEPLAQIIPPILRYYFRIMLSNEGGTRLGLDDETLHDMRVAIRKIRTALTVFSPSIPRTGAWQVRRNLKWIAGLLGAVRDCDVLREWLSDDPKFLELLPPLEKLRVARRERLLFQLSQRRYRQFTTITMPRFLQQSFVNRLNRRYSIRPVLKFAGASLSRRFKNIERNIKQALNSFTTISDRELHKLRIMFKKLRYSLEYFTPLYDSRQLRELTRQFQEIQDKLGVFVDTLFIPEILNDLARMAAFQKDSPKTHIQELLTFLGAKVVAEKKTRKAEVQVALTGLIAAGTLRTRLKSPGETVTK